MQNEVQRIEQCGGIMKDGEWSEIFVRRVENGEWILKTKHRLWRTMCVIYSMVCEVWRMEVEYRIQTMNYGKGILGMGHKEQRSENGE